jgi:hypothetical protein
VRNVERATNGIPTKEINFRMEYSCTIRWIFDHFLSSYLNAFTNQCVLMSSRRIDWEYFKFYCHSLIVNLVGIQVLINPMMSSIGSKSYSILINYLLCMNHQVVPSLHELLRTP